MKAARWIIAMGMPWIAGPAPAQPTHADGLSGHVLTMSCQADAAHAFTVTLAGTDGDEVPEASAPSAVEVPTGGVASFAADERPVRTFHIGEDQSMECRFANGHRVKVRTAMETPPFLGRCNADPGIVLSLWVDGRKLDSRAPLAGRCRSYEYAPVTYRIDGQGAERCDEVPNTGVATQPPGHGCTRLPAAAGLPVDTAEYPAPGSVPAPPAGTLRMALRRDEVCDRVGDELRTDWRAFDPYHPPEHAQAVRRIDWGHRNVDTALPEGWSFAYAATRTAEFDFDNDGRIDRVFLNDNGGEGGRYWSPMLIRYGRAASVFEAADAPLHAVPCQWDPRRPALSDCDDLTPPSSTRRLGTEQALPDPTGRTLDPAWYRTRYTTFQPVRYHDTTWVVAFPAGVPSRDHVAVLRPRPDRGYDAVCLIERIAPNL